MNGWIAFWTVLVVINTASLINHIVNNTFPWFALMGLVCAAVCLGYNIAKTLWEVE